MTIAGAWTAPSGSVMGQDPPGEAAERVSQLRGRAYLGRNAPVVGATVLVQSEDRSSALFLTSSDEDGVFRVDGLADGSYRVQVEREGLQPETKEGVSLKFPFRAVVELQMSPLAVPPAGGRDLVPDATGDGEPLSLRGRVLESGAGPLGDVQLRFVRLDGREDPQTFRSARDGTFELQPAGAGLWRVEVSGVGYLSQRMALPLHGSAFLTLILVRQPADYDPTPLELMPPEQPIPPAGFTDGSAAR
jgi:hypothetical protein